MADNTQQIETILRLNVDYQEGIKAVGEYINEIKKLKEQQKVLNAQLEFNQISEKEWATAMAASKATMTQLKGEMKVLTTEIRHKLEADRADAKQIDINNASYNKLSATYKQMKQRINEMDAAERQRNKDYIEQSKKVYDRMKQLQAETGKMQLNVGNYQSAITQLITGNSKFASSLMGVAGGATNMGQALGFANQNVMAMGQALKLLLTNPAFLAIAGIAGAGMAFKWFKDYNEGIAEATRLTKQFTGLVDGNLDNIRDAIQATADSFGKDFKDVLQSADTLVSNFGVNWREAVDIINQGFAAGADINGDMLNKIKQYGPAFNDAGLSASEFVAIIQQTRSGVFSDAGLDAILKASKALRDMSTSTANSLKNVGINADDLKRRLADGSIDMMQAVGMVAGKLKEVGTNTQEAGALISDVFGKKGVAAGQEQLKAIADLNTELETLVENEGEYGRLQLKIVETQEQINAYTSALFHLKGWDEMKKAAELYWKTGLLSALQLTVKVTNAFIDLYNISEKGFRLLTVTVTASAATAWDAMKTLFTLISEAVTAVGNQMKGFGDIIEGIFTFSADKIKSGWSSVTGALTGAWRNSVVAARAFGVAAGNNYVNGWNAALSGAGVGHIDVPTFSADGSVSGGTTPTGGGSGATSSGGSGGGSSSSAKAAAAKAARENKAAREQAAKDELEILQRIWAERLALAKKGSEEELNIRLQQLKTEEELAKKKLQAEIMDEQQREELLYLMEQNYEKKRADLRAAFDESERQRLEQGVANTFTERLMQAADNELEIERIKLEQAQLLRDTARQKEGETIEQFNARRLQLEQDYIDAKKNLVAKEVEVQQVKYEAMASITNGIGQLFSALGEKDEEFAKMSKVLALAEIAINTGKAIAAGVAQAQSVPFPANIAAIATTVATILANIATAISTVNSAKFARGGLIEGLGTGTSDSITARVSNGESIMTANATAMFSPLLSAINQLGGGVPIMRGGSSAQVGEDMLAAAIAKGYAMAPSPVVSVKEITDVGNRVRVIEEMARS